MVRNEDTRMSRSTKPHAPLPCLGESENILELLDRLASFPFFSSLSSPQLECVKNMITMLKAGAGEILNAPGNPTRDLYVLFSGTIMIYYEEMETLIHCGS